MAAAERRHEPGRIRVSPQRQSGQLQPRRPPLGAGYQRLRRHGRQARPRRLAQQRRRLLGGEAQVGGAQLSQLPAGPQPRQRQRRVSPAGHHHPQARRQILQQERHRLVHRPGIDQVIVIQDQQHLIRAGIGGQLIDQDRQPFRRTRRQWAHPPGQPRPSPVQRGHRVAPEPGRVAVAAIQAQPRHLPPAAGGPVRQQRRLAESRRCAHQHPAPSQPLAERLHQTPARHKTRLRPGHMQLGRQQDILPGHGNPRRGRHRRISHR